VLSSPGISEFIRTLDDMKVLDDLIDSYERPESSVPGEAMSSRENQLLPLAEAAAELKKGYRTEKGEGDPYLSLAYRYIEYKNRADLLEREKNADRLKATAAGRIGSLMETITRHIGLDYRTNIALIGGLAAKEVIVSTLGTAYSLGEEGLEAKAPLPERLRADKGWNPLVAFTLILFTMLYVPCLVTLVSIARESSWLWAGFSVCFNLFTAFIISFIVYQTGLALGIGV